MIRLRQTPKFKSGFMMLRECKPFVANKMGVLIHRPLYINLHKVMVNGRLHRWMSIGHACGNSHCGSDKFTFLDSLDDSQILCKRCEEKAIEYGYPSAIEICGKHVHVGGVKAIKECCN